MSLQLLAKKNKTLKNQSSLIKCHPHIMTKLNVNPILPPLSYTGPQIIDLYNIPVIKPINRQVKIAIVIAYHHPNLLSDLKTYWQSPVNFGVNSTPPTINVFNLGRPNNINSNWAGEECLDVQMIATVNPNANICVVEAVSDLQRDLLYAVDYATNTINADIISMSWGSTDMPNLNNNSVFNNPSNPSKYKCFCASSGDNNYVSWPSVLSNCIAVGGTSLIWSPSKNNLSPRTEYTWSDAGCGYSTSILKPSYQNSVNNNKYRSIPDVSLMANPNTGVNIIYNGMWGCVGGTSLSCPLFAGILSLANQQRFNNNMNPLTTVYTTTPTSSLLPPTNMIPSTNIQNYLYNVLYPSGNYSKCFYDVNMGSDGVFNASNMFDIATGLGSPNVTMLCNALNF